MFLLSYVYFSISTIKNECFLLYRLITCTNYRLASLLSKPGTPEWEILEFTSMLHWARSYMLLWPPGHWVITGFHIYKWRNFQYRKHHWQKSCNSSSFSERPLDSNKHRSIPSLPKLLLLDWAVSLLPFWDTKSTTKGMAKLWPLDYISKIYLL